MSLKETNVQGQREEKVSSKPVLQLYLHRFIVCLKTGSVIQL